MNSAKEKVEYLAMIGHYSSDCLSILSMIDWEEEDEMIGEICDNAE